VVSSLSLLTVRPDEEINDLADERGCESLRRYCLTRLGFDNR
jgi:hypothetical protein